VAKAYQYANSAHADQKRKTGESYFDAHLVPTANDLLRDGVTDQVILSGALLHDAAEDTHLSLEIIRQEFSDEVADLVEVVTNIKSAENGQMEEERLDKMAVVKVAEAFPSDPRGPIIKLYERKRNMETLYVFDERKRRAKALETLNVYARMAEAYGLWQKKIELEDLAFQYTDPSAYAKARQDLDTDPRTQETFILTYSNLIWEALEINHLEAFVDHKINGIYALQQKKEQGLLKAKARQLGFSDINDVVSFRVLVDSEEDCYQALASVCNLFSDDGGKIGFYNSQGLDNYLARPQINGYSALHITITTPLGPVEVAITTHEKEEVNNFGVLAHINNARPENISDYAPYLVFSPNGRVCFVRQEARVLDVIYALFPDKAEQIEAVRSNGNTLALTDKVPNAATFTPILSVFPSRTSDPTLIALALPETRMRMEEKFLREERAELIQEGEKIMEQLLSPRGLFHFDDLPGDLQRQLLAEMEVSDNSDLYIHMALSDQERFATTQSLDKLEITKERLGFTSIRTKGLNKPGIMAKVSGLISEKGGNIVADHSIFNDGIFIWRLGIYGLSHDINLETGLLKEISSTDFFETVELV